MKQAFILLYAAMFGYLASKHYFIGDTVFWAGVVLIPYVVGGLPRQQISHRFGLPTLLLLVAACFIPTYSVRFLLLVFAVLFAAESLWGRLNGLLLVVLLIISPLFRLVSESFTFPIRLQLSQWVGTFLSGVGLPVLVSGNVIQLHGVDYVVEPACVGLQGTGLSLLLVVFLMVHQQRTTSKTRTEMQSMGLLLLAFLLNIVSNLFRMTTLVFFKILPENPLHDLTGLLCLVVYVGIPMALLVSFVSQKDKNVALVQPETTGQTASVLHFVLVGLVAWVLLLPVPSPHSKAFELQRIKTANALIYVKPIAAFYSSEHNPTVCWRGSGYVFERVRQEQINGKTIYAGTLRKGNETLQTAWWFSDGKKQTTSQLEWRWQMLMGNRGPFRLINITAANELDLRQNVKKWLFYSWHD